MIKCRFIVGRSGWLMLLPTIIYTRWHPHSWVGMVDTYRIELAWINMSLAFEVERSTEAGGDHGHE